MANIKDLKKDINYITYEVIADCNTFMSINPDKKQDVIKIVNQAVSVRNKMIEKVNNPESISKKYFRNIKLELLNNADEMFQQLRKLLK